MVISLRVNDQFQNLLKITELGTFKVECRIPRDRQMIRGVIGPIGLDTPLSEIKKELGNSFPNLIDVDRLNKGKEKQPTLSIRLTFKGDILPNNIILWSQKFNTRIYVNKPWQCYNCQKFGHNADICKSKSCCATCSENHKTEDCPQ